MKRLLPLLVALSAFGQTQTINQTVAWDPVLCDGYRIYSSQSGVGGWKLLATVPSSVTNFTVVIPAKKAYLTVTATNVVGESLRSNILQLP